MIGITTGHPWVSFIKEHNYDFCMDSQATLFGFLNQSEYSSTNGSSVSPLADEAKILCEEEIINNKKYCGCGCGEKVARQRSYINGHWNQKQILDKKIRFGMHSVFNMQLCRCGCGKNTELYQYAETGNSKGQPKMFIKGHNAHRKYKFNEFYFINLNDKSAYILGYIFAEGSNQGSNTTIETCDKDIINFVGTEFGIPIKTRKRIKEGKGIYNRTYYINICSKKITEYLIDVYKLKSPKSNNLVFPDIDNLLMRYFILGYFEGDGSIKFHNIFFKRLTVEFTSASKLFLLSIKQWLGNCLLVKGRFHQYNGKLYYKLCFNISDSFKILKWMYNNNTINIGAKHKLYCEYNQRMNNENTARYLKKRIYE